MFPLCGWRLSHERLWRKDMYLEMEHTMSRRYPISPTVTLLIIPPYPCRPSPIPICQEEVIFCWKDARPISARSSSWQEKYRIHFRWVHREVLLVACHVVLVRIPSIYHLPTHLSMSFTHLVYPYSCSLSFLLCFVILLFDDSPSWPYDPFPPYCSLLFFHFPDIFLISCSTWSHSILPIGQWPHATAQHPLNLYSSMSHWLFTLSHRYCVIAYSCLFKPVLLHVYKGLSFAHSQ